MPHGNAVSTCHNCGNAWISGCVIITTCPECREKGHTDGFLDCPACRRELDKLRHEATLALLKDKKELQEKVAALELQVDDWRKVLADLALHRCCDEVCFGPCSTKRAANALKKYECSEKRIDRPLKIVVNGETMELAAGGSSLSYEDVLKLAGEREGASVVCKPKDQRLAGFSLS